jgi:hypothetical protein
MSGNATNDTFWNPILATLLQNAIMLSCTTSKNKETNPIQDNSYVLDTSPSYSFYWEVLQAS